MKFKKLKGLFSKEKKKKPLLSIWFYVLGNPRDEFNKKGVMTYRNPYPAPRLNAAKRYTKTATEYEAWKSYVWESYRDSLVMEGDENILKDIDNKKYKLRFKTFLRLNKSLRIADKDNIVKGIVDALLHKTKNVKRKKVVTEERLMKDDLRVVATYDYGYGKRPAVEIIIEVVKDG